MEYRHEVINYGESVPVKCFVHQLGYSARHWHNSIEILFVLSGSVEIIIAGIPYTLKEDDMVLINSNEPHELMARECILTAVQIKLSMFDDKLTHARGFFFDCNSATRPNDPGMVRIKRIIAHFVKNYGATDEGRIFRAKSLSYALLSELITFYKAERGDADETQTRYHYERITRIVDYINEHYRENITLQTLAEQEYLSVPYLSKFFMRMMGMNFSTYLNQLRLNHAMNDLMNTTYTIDQIASRNGFSYTHAFVQLFKKKYGELPSQYRKQGAVNKEMDNKLLRTQGSSNEYTILDTHQYLNYFAAYLDDGPTDSALPEMAPLLSSHYTIDAAVEGKALRHTWHGFMAVGSAKELLLHEVQQMLRSLQREVGFRYIKFHGILSDDMRVYTIDRYGKPHYSFVYVDQVLDFLLSLDIKPLIQLSFMPKEMAVEPEHIIFNSSMINSPPANMDDWCDLVHAFLEHIIGRYGQSVVHSWLFTVWNEPDTPRSMFGFPSAGEFYLFYQRTFETIKRVSPALRIGSPSTYFDWSDSGSWLCDFTQWCKEHGCMPEFILIHYYGTTVTHETVVEKGQEITLDHIQLTQDENMLKKSIDILLSYVRGAYPPDMPVYLTEWNFSPSHRQLLGDTCFRSCYLVKNILENYDRLDSMGYWLLTDLFEEHPVPMEVFHGGLGMFTYNGIKKPAYYAFYLLGKLGNTYVDSGDGYFLTREGNDYQLMLYHYKHYSALYASGEAFDMTFTDRYTPFEPEQKRDFEIRINGLMPGNWKIMEYLINRQSGSSFDKWVEMGAQPLESREEIELLGGLSFPMINKYTIVSTARGLTVNALLEPLEVRMILLRM